MANNCEECVHYDYDDEIEAYFCSMDLDEDETHDCQCGGSCGHHHGGHHHG